jgi:hypothetical protein
LKGDDANALMQAWTLVMTLYFGCELQVYDLLTMDGKSIIRATENRNTANA